MRTLRFHEFGEPADVLRLETADAPDPRAGHIRVRVEACGLNPADWALCRGLFPGDLPQQDKLFDAATALAVTEHIPEEELATWAKSLAGMMAPGGAMVITVPAPTVDKILHLLIALRLIAGIEAHQHHGFKPSDLDTIFSAPQWRRRKHRRFQLGLNHLYVFERTKD